MTRVEEVIHKVITPHFEDEDRAGNEFEEVQA